jgi:diguanylate cyclase
VEAINRVAQGMGLRTIAEYVETEAILDCVHGLGVDYAQGYATGRPAPLRDHLTRRLSTPEPSRPIEAIAAGR